VRFHLELDRQTASRFAAIALGHVTRETGHNVRRERRSCHGVNPVTGREVPHARADCCYDSGAFQAELGFGPTYPPPSTVEDIPSATNRGPFFYDYRIKDMQTFVSGLLPLI